jgi:hypothetical protein
MAKGKVKFPLDRITGTLSGVDRTIGRNPGFVTVMRGMHGPSTVPHSPTYNTSIAATKAPTRGGSKNRHTRAERYCYCDEAYSIMGWPKFNYLQPWWRAVTDDPHAQMSGYHILMKICLKYMAEQSAFSRFSYVSRYRVFNISAADWDNQPVEFRSIPTFQVDGQDVEIYQLLAMTTKKSRITYDPLMIDFRLSHEVTERGKAVAIVPFLKAFTCMLVDVYSWYNPEML